jgi:primosomal protein N'
MTTTQSTIATDFPDTVDLVAEFDRVEALRRHHEDRALDATDRDLSRAQYELARQAEDRGTEIIVELNNRGHFNR